MSGPPAPHQDLLHAGLLSCYAANLHFTFVSHQWIGRGFPDPEGLQLQVLRKALKSGFHVVSSVRDQVERGGGRTMPDEARRAVLAGFLWVDFFGVPQIGVERRRASMHDFKAAIESIPSYVKLCRAFVTLAPSMFHEDGSLANFATYLSRGWCRTELLFWKLTAEAESRPVISLRGAGNMPLYEPNSLSEGLSPFTAAFTAEGDRKTVCELARGYLHELIAQQLANAGKAEVGSKRWKQFMGGALMKAVEVEFYCGPPDSNSCTFQQANGGQRITAFEQCYEAMDEAATRRHLGISRVYLAACAGKADLLTTALKHADPGDLRLGTKVPSDEAKLLGFTPLSLAAHMGHAACIKLLLEHRADVNSKVTKLQLTPMGFASSSKRASVDAIDVLLTARADIVSCHVLQSAIQLAVQNDVSAIKITRLLEARADIHHRGIVGASLLFLTATNVCDAHHIVDLLVNARAAVDAPRGRRTCLVATLDTFTYARDAISGMCGEWSHVIGLQNGDSLTALHVATYNGNWKICEALLAHGASTQAIVRGRTPLEIARAQGTEVIFQHVVEAATVWV
eukprot:TRINITY_DN6340_c1_g7_i1.p1 TRINITY_DN6340_c1_g7~~TRINITY_DN6340_c1_g7_i1.p1  ORF type:complete len:623 (+),score=80.78 TRINITY_DN6340_c1_g7_i1:165-1871(+)